MNKKIKKILIFVGIFVAALIYNKINGINIADTPAKKASETKVEKISFEEYVKSKIVIIEEKDDIIDVALKISSQEIKYFYENERNKKIIGESTYPSEEEYLTASYFAIEVYKQYKDKDVVVVDTYNGSIDNTNLRIARFVFSKKYLEKTNNASLDIIDIYKRPILDKSGETGVTIMMGLKKDKALFNWDLIKWIILEKYSLYSAENFK